MKNLFSNFIYLFMPVRHTDNLEQNESGEGGRNDYQTRFS